METIKGRITHATKTEAEWNKSTVVLLKGEVGFASDTQVIKVGNGVDTWKNLKSHQGGKGDKGDPLTIKTTTTLSNGDTKITFSDGKTLTIPKGKDGTVTFESLTQAQKDEIKGADGKSITVSSTTKDSQGNTVITFSDNTKVTISKGDRGATGANGKNGSSVTITSNTTDSSGNAVITFSDGTRITIPKGDRGATGSSGKDGTDGKSITVSSQTKDSSGNTVVTFSDSTQITINKGDQGERGYRGYSGTNGKDGADGKSITITGQTKDSQGNTVISFSDGSTVTVNKGDRGLTGARGTNGSDGKDGTSITTWTGTESQYNAIYRKSDTTLYIITE